MATSKELKAISKSRLKSAKTLMASGDYDGAVYLMGYCFECALKAVICKRLNFINYPDKSGDGEKVNIFKTHKFDILLALSGMEQDFNLNLSPSRRVENWSTLTKWNTEIRYEPIGTHTKPEAERMHTALTEKPEGILTWISKYKKW